MRSGLFLIVPVEIWLALRFAFRRCSAAGFGGSLLLLFKGLLHLFAALGASFGALFPLLVENLLRADQLDEGFFTAIAFAISGADDAQIAALTIAVAGRDGLKETLHRFAAQQVRSSETAGGDVAALAEGNHLLDVGTHRLCLRDSGLDALFQDERSHEVAQQGATVTRVPA